MTRFFVLWGVLGITATLAAYGLGLAVFRFVDLTFPQLTILLIAPGVQAAVLTWPAGVLQRGLSAYTQVRRHPLTGPVLLLEGLLVATGLLWWSTSVLGFGATITVQPTWIAVKAVAVGAIALLGWPGGSLSHRAILVATSVLIAGQALSSGVESGVQWAITALPSVAEVWVRLASYGLLCALGLVLAQRITRAWDDGRFWITVTVAGSVLAAVLVMLSMFNHPGVVQPWRGLALLCVSVSVTALLLAVLAQSRAARVQS